MKQRSCDGRGNAPKKTGARSARARTRGQNLLVKNKEHCGRRVPISMCGGTLCPSVPDIPTGRNTAPLKWGGTLSPSKAEKLCVPQGRSNTVPLGSCNPRG